MISNQALKEFMEVWEEEFGTQIDSDFAISEAVTILNLFNRVYKPVQKSWIRNNKNENGKAFTENQPLSVKL